MSLYGIIADLRRENPTPSTAKTLDMVVAELGRTRDNLRLAVERLGERAVPSGGKPLLEELLLRARQAGVDDLEMGPAPDEIPVAEPIDEGSMGIAVLITVTTLVVLGLAVAAVALAINAVVHQ